MQAAALAEATDALDSIAEFGAPCRCKYLGQKSGDAYEEGPGRWEVGEGERLSQKEVFFEWRLLGHTVAAPVLANNALHRGIPVPRALLTRMRRCEVREKDPAGA